MLTKKEIEFLIELYNNNNKLTAKEQKSFNCINHFYRVITKLKRMNLINSYIIEIFDKRMSIYELTIRGMTLIKIILGEDY